MEEHQVLPLIMEFRGGAELLFNNKQRHHVFLPGVSWTLKQLLYWLQDNLLTGKPELFIQNNTVRPGILVLVNNADWELLDKDNYQLAPRDTVTFISTLHGG